MTYPLSGISFETPHYALPTYSSLKKVRQGPSVSQVGSPGHTGGSSTGTPKKNSLKVIEGGFNQGSPKSLAEPLKERILKVQADDSKEVRGTIYVDKENRVDFKSSTGHRHKAVKSAFRSENTAVVSEKDVSEYEKGLNLIEDFESRCPEIVEMAKAQIQQNEQHIGDKENEILSVGPAKVQNEDSENPYFFSPDYFFEVLFRRTQTGITVQDYMILLDSFTSLWRTLRRYDNMKK